MKTVFLLAVGASAIDVSLKANPFANVNAIVAGKRAKKKHTLSRPMMETMPMIFYKEDCWKRLPTATAFLQQAKKTPGAGMDKDAIEPFVTVEKDGFFEVGCLKDGMLLEGDKHGAGRFTYKMGDIANVSIVHYADFVAKEDRKEMTHEVCFEFCRTVPDMSFFGLNAGVDCYCAPYFKKVASDSSSCDQTCPGKKTVTCGGIDKSSMFEMHSCDDTAKVLEDTAAKAEDAFSALEDALTGLKQVAEQAETDANAMQGAFGKAGGSEASNLMQGAKVFAGKCIRAADEGQKLLDEVKPTTEPVAEFEGQDLKSFEVAKKVEDVIKKMEKAIAESDLKTEELQALMDEASPSEDEERVADSAKQYLPLMTYVDKKFQDAPSTCSGDVLQTIFGKSMDACAAACDDLVGKCVGFSYFGEGDGMCFLIGKFKTVKYWTGCNEEGFLQMMKKKEAPWMATCVAKDADFQGLSLKPDKSGKNEFALKEAEEAKRCFEK